MLGKKENIHDHRDFFSSSTVRNYSKFSFTCVYFFTLNLLSNFVLHIYKLSNTMSALKFSYYSLYRSQIFNLKKSFELITHNSEMKKI